MPKMRSANPLGARQIVRTALPLVILALALLLAGPAFSASDQGGSNGPPPEDPPGEELVSPPDDDDDGYSSSGSDNSGSFFIRPQNQRNQVELRFDRTQEELARLFVMSSTDIAQEFPAGGFDRALVQAANRARRADRALNRR